MEFLKLTKFRNYLKSNEGKDPVIPETTQEELKSENGTDQLKTTAADSNGETVGDDDDDFITNEVKRQLKELRNRRFMVLIPEESCPEDEDDDTGSSDWKETLVEGRDHCLGFGCFYEKYCERMLFFNKMSAQLLKVVGKCH